MPWYKAGTVSVTLNSNAVTGAGTSFIANCRVGDAFRGPDGRWYEVTNASSDTALSIDPPYQGATTSAGSYALAPMQGYVKDSADALRAFVNTYGAKLAALGTTGNYEILPVSKGGTGGATQTDARVGLGLVPQTSTSDATAGRLLTPGAFGLGGSTIPIAEADLDADRVNGRYNVISSGAGKLPINVNGYLRHWKNPSTGYAFQTYRPVTGTVEYTRTQAAGTWGSWVLNAQGTVPVAQGGTGGTDQATARTGLGLGTAATQNTGTSGATVPLLNGANTWGNSQIMPSLELSAATPFIDFHLASSSADYTCRIIHPSSTGLDITTPSSTGMKIGAVLYPNTDGGINCGTATNRFATVYASAGTINTSDAREKTGVTSLSEAEVSAAIALGKEIGTYKWLSAIEKKGDGARLHVGMTVQRAIEVMESFGLTPLNYAFVCYDEWEAIERETKEIARGNIYSVGDLAYTNVPYSEFEAYGGHPSFTWEETSREIVVIQEGREAGNRYGFRYDQLALFIARGQEERLSRLEALLTPAA